MKQNMTFQSDHQKICRGAKIFYCTSAGRCSVPQHGQQAHGYILQCRLNEHLFKCSEIFQKCLARPFRVPSYVNGNATAFIWPAVDPVLIRLLWFADVVMLCYFLVSRYSRGLCWCTCWLMVEMSTAAAPRGPVPAGKADPGVLL